MAQLLEVLSALQYDSHFGATTVVASPAAASPAAGTAADGIAVAAEESCSTWRRAPLLSAVHQRRQQQQLQRLVVAQKLSALKNRWSDTCQSFASGWTLCDVQMLNSLQTQS